MERLKLILENDLNKVTIRRLLEIIMETTDNVYNEIDGNKILEITGNNMELLKNYYKNIIDSIQKLE